MKFRPVFAACFPLPMRLFWLDWKRSCFLLGITLERVPRGVAPEGDAPLRQAAKCVKTHFVYIVV